IDEFLYFSQYNANKISKIDINLLPIILGVPDMDLKGITVYPNPTNDILYINSQEPVASVNIYSVTGRLIKQSLSSNINVADLPAGLYFAKIFAHNRTITQKFIKS